MITWKENGERGESWLGLRPKKDAITETYAL